MTNTKPFVQAACICEKALVEDDKVVSLIRIVDRFTLKQGVPLPAGMTTGMALTIFVSIKPGDVTGEHKIGLRLRQPNKPPNKTNWWPVELGGGNTGASLKLQIGVADPTDGLNWFDVLWNTEEEVLTAIPFQITHTQAQTSGGATD